jgi:epoxyqueuosine reductase QueG
MSRITEGYDVILTNMIKALAVELGADLIGIGPVERWKNAPERLRPEAHLPGAKSVIVVAIHHPDAVIELGGEPTPQDQGPYEIQIDMNWKLDYISFNIARFLEKKGYEAIPFAASNIWRYRPYKDIDTHFTADFSHRHAAVAAGLGELGWNGLLLTPEYGPRQRVVSIITNAPLEPTPMYSGPPLCDRCMECVKACPTDAFRKEVERFHVVKIEDKVFTYPRKNMWRCSWGEHWGLDLSLPIPEKVTEQVIWDMLSKYGVRGGEMGSCLRYCMVPQLRHKDPAYTRVYRRKKRLTDSERTSVNRVASYKVKSIPAQWGVKIIRILSTEDFREAALKPEDYLPGAKSVVLLGIDYPQPPKKAEAIPLQIKDAAHYISDSALQLLRFAMLDICRYLDSLGYAAMPTWKEISAIDVYAAKITGLLENTENTEITTHTFGRHFVSVLTDAPLEPDSKEQFLMGKHGVLLRTKSLTEDLKKEASRLDADLFGVAPLDRLSDVAGFKELTEFLPEAKSIIVIGIHYPDATVERAEEPPAESPGSYGFIHYHTIRQLCYIAIHLSNYLKDRGYFAIPVMDITGDAGTIASPRGELPDIWANRYAAVAAGLGELGWNGLLLTPEYGPRQRVVSIITDAPLEPSPMYNGPPLCDRCMQCVEACPVKAISSNEKTSVKIGDRIFEYGIRDCSRCDWAKRYALLGEEGPKYLGATHDIKPPDKITAQAIQEGLKKLDPATFYRNRLIGREGKIVVAGVNTVIVEGCLRACMPPHLRYSDPNYSRFYRRKTHE